MIDYSESLIKLKKLTHQYQSAILKGQFDAAADFAVDMQIAGVNLSKDQRREFWEIAHRRTIGELFERNLIKC